ncbi:hypothetical protein Cpir12675_002249 [Ceratocystis pirilliformis]|uniref:Uncharacterized protein n=1 Tax=Ceratocystis pirilliformis TaxID=259994 RepID=A0ABR3ZBQ3_9PEZI
MQSSTPSPLPSHSSSQPTIETTTSSVSAPATVADSSPLAQSTTTATEPAAEPPAKRSTSDPPHQQSLESRTSKTPPAITAKSSASARPADTFASAPAPALATAREAAADSLKSVATLLAKIRELFSITIKATFQISSSNVQLSLQAIGATAAVVVFLNLEIGYKLLRLWVYALTTLQRIVRDLVSAIVLSLAAHYNVVVTSIAKSRLVRSLWLDLFVRYLIIGPRLPDDIRDVPEAMEPGLNQKQPANSRSLQQTPSKPPHQLKSPNRHASHNHSYRNTGGCHTHLQSDDDGLPMCPPYSPDFHATDLLCHPQPQQPAQTLSQVATQDSLRATSHTTSSHSRSFSL